MTNALERLLESPARRERRDPQAIAHTVGRGIDLLELLARDASRRLDGHPPALLDEAVQSLLDEVNRITAASDTVTPHRAVCIRGPWRAPGDIDAAPADSAS